MRNRAKVNDDFPAPVRPTTPTLSPGFTSNDILLRTSSKPSRYRVLYLSKLIDPFCGQLGSGLFSSLCQSAFYNGLIKKNFNLYIREINLKLTSIGVRVYSKHLSTETILVSKLVVAITKLFKVRVIVIA